MTWLDQSGCRNQVLVPTNFSRFPRVNKKPYVKGRVLIQ